jgi:hypothetical protein
MSRQCREVMAAAEAHASDTGLLALPEVFEADADEAVRADRHCRSLFPGGRADVAVHVDPPLVRTKATPPYAHQPRRSIPGCTLEHDAALGSRRTPKRRQQLAQPSASRPKAPLASGGYIRRIPVTEAPHRLLGRSPIERSTSGTCVPAADGSVRDIAATDH